MTTPLESKIQFFADEINAQIVAIENTLMGDEESRLRDRQLVYKCTVLENVLEQFEEIFEDIVYKESK